MEHSEYKYFSWHIPQWQQLWNGREIPHALLLTGPAGIGKSAFARALAARLLCSAPGADGACGQCHDCRWLAQGNHPDYIQVIPEADAEAAEGGAGEGEKKKAKTQIVIDQIRALADFVYVGAHHGGAKVILIDPADAMNLPAANALLKILEEPPPSVYFLLITRSETSLIPTVRSRCRILKLPKPPATAAAAWLDSECDPEAARLLDFVGGAPLAAAAATGKLGRNLQALLGSFAEPGGSPGELAQRWERMVGAEEGQLRMEELVSALQKWVYALSALNVAGRQRFLGAQAAAAGQLARKASAGNLLRCYNDLLKIRALASHPLNSRLMLEDMAERYLRALATDRR